MTGQWPLNVDKARLYVSQEVLLTIQLLTLYKVQIRSGLTYLTYLETCCPINLSILDAAPRSAIGLIGDPTLTCHLHRHSYWHAVVLLKINVIEIRDIWKWLRARLSCVSPYVLADCVKNAEAIKKKEEEED
nr:unnamed protein product [Callosobruchus chinensis]